MRRIDFSPFQNLEMGKSNESLGHILVQVCIYIFLIDVDRFMVIFSYFRLYM